MNQIKVLRNQFGIKQAELAKAVNVSQAALSGYETGKYEADLDTYKKIADYFSVSLDYLLTGEQDNTPLINNDPELTAYLEELRTRPEMRMLFSVTKEATKQDVEQAVRIIEALRGKPDVDT